MHISEILKDETFYITGSSAYGKEPKDIDVCVLCRDYYRDFKALHAKILEATNDQFIVAQEYEIPFTWGGRTYERGNYKNYDIFIVDLPTYKTVKKATQALMSQPPRIKQALIKSKAFRIELFQSFAKQLYRA